MTDTATAHRPAWNRAVSDGDAARLAAEIERDGYAVLENFISKEELQPIRALARAAVERNGGEYIAFIGADAFPNTTLERLPRSEAFKSLCRRLYEIGCGKPAPPVEFYQITRMLQGSTSRTHSYRFHYDSYVLTVLIPIEIPTSGQTGSLLLFPNQRPVRQSYAANILDKMLVDNRFAQKRFLRRSYGAGTKVISISMVPGNIYFFWGYRSLHTNEACDPDKLRATALLHYGDPHRSSRLRMMLRKTA